MRRVKTIAVLMVVAVVFAAMASGCAMNPQKQLLGKWMDSSGLSGYEFLEDGKVKRTMFSFTVPIVEKEVNGTFDGFYTLDKKEDTLKIVITISNFGISVDSTYKFEIDEDTLTLTDTKTNKTTSYTRQSAE